MFRFKYIVFICISFNSAVDCFGWPMITKFLVSRLWYGSVETAFLSQFQKMSKISNLRLSSLWERFFYFINKLLLLIIIQIIKQKKNVEIRTTISIDPCTFNSQHFSFFSPVLTNVGGNPFPPFKNVENHRGRWGKTTLSSKKSRQNVLSKILKNKRCWSLNQ